MTARANTRTDAAAAEIRVKLRMRSQEYPICAYAVASASVRIEDGTAMRSRLSRVLTAAFPAARRSAATIRAAARLPGAALLSCTARLAGATTRRLAGAAARRLAGAAARRLARAAAAFRTAAGLPGSA